MFFQEKIWRLLLRASLTKDGLLLGLQKNFQTRSGITEASIQFLTMISSSCKTVLRHTVPKQLKIFSRQHARFHQLTRMDTAFTRAESTRLLYLGIGTYCKDLTMKEGVIRLQTSKILTLLSEKNGMMSMIRQ